MEALRKTIESYLRNQTRLRKQSLRLSVNLKNFGDNEATQLGDFLSTFGDAVNAREMIREEAMTKVALYSIEPLKLYPVSLSIMTSVNDIERFISIEIASLQQTQTGSADKRIRHGQRAAQAIVS